MLIMTTAMLRYEPLNKQDQLFLILLNNLNSKE